MPDKEIVWAPQKGPQKALVDCPIPEILFGGSRGGGKCLPLTEPVLTPFGWRKMVDIKVGSQVCNPNGTVSRVIATHRPGKAKTWKVTFSDGSQAVCDDEHIWLGHYVGHTIKRGGLRLWRFKEIREKVKKGGKFLIPLTDPVVFTRPRYTRHGDSRPLDGYLLGVLLGDGSLTGDTVRYATEDDEIDNFMASYGTVRVDEGPNRRLIDCPDIKNGLKKLKVWGKGALEKSVPDSYLWADGATRKAVLQGLMDTDGTVDSVGHCSFASSSYDLAKDAQFLAWSLGFKATLSRHLTTHADSYRLYINGPGRADLFRINRKRERALQDYQNWHSVRRITDITEDGVKEVGCFQVDDPNGLFLTRDFVVTHNTDGVLGKYALKAERYGKYFNGIFFRKELPMLDDAIDRSMEIYGALGWKWNDQKKTWKSPKGARLRFRPLESIADAEKYQGQNITDACVEEAGNYPDPAPIDRINGVLRSVHGVPTQLILTGNPGGPGQQWIKKRYIDPCRDGMKLLHRDLPNGKQHPYIFIPSNIKDNRLLNEKDPDYVNRLYLVGGKELVRAWLEGDWDAIEGAYFDEWDTSIHVLDPIELPDHWMRFRAMDWGSAKPFDVQWYAIAGEDYLAPQERGNIWIPKGAMVCYREWYGAKKDQDGTSIPNVGAKMFAEEVGQGIWLREKNDPEISYGVIDPQAFAEDGGPSIAHRMMKATDWKVVFRKADNRRVARRGAMGGWDQLRARLRGEDFGDPMGVRPMIYWFSTCQDLIRTLPALQHEDNRPEDVATDMEDHAADCARFGAMSRPWINESPIEIPPETDIWGRPKREQNTWKTLL